MYLVSSKTCRRFHSLLYLKIMLMDKISFFVVDCGRPRLGRALFIHFPSILPQFFFSMAFFLYLSFISFHACAQLPVFLFVCMILWFFMQTCWRFFIHSLFLYFIKKLITRLSRVFALRFWWHSINLSSLCEKACLVQSNTWLLTSLIDTIVR